VSLKVGLRLGETNEEKKACGEKIKQFRDFCKTVKESLGSKLEGLLANSINYTVEVPNI
jgi:hypothetical protein